MKGLESRQVSFPLAWQEREAIEGFEMKAALSKIGRGRTINPFEKKERLDLGSLEGKPLNKYRKE